MSTPKRQSHATEGALPRRNAHARPLIRARSRSLTGGREVTGLDFRAPAGRRWPAAVCPVWTSLGRRQRREAPKWAYGQRGSCCQTPGLWAARVISGHPIALAYWRTAAADRPGRQREGPAPGPAAWTQESRPCWRHPDQQPSAGPGQRRRRVLQRRQRPVRLPSPGIEGQATRRRARRGTARGPARTGNGCTCAPWRPAQARRVTAHRSGQGRCAGRGMAGGWQRVDRAGCAR
jgi:hypothetical protein